MPVTDSYRKPRTSNKVITNTSISHEKIRKIVLKSGMNNIEKRRNKIIWKNQLIAGLKEITALFGKETDGLWINLQKEKMKEWNNKQQTKEIRNKREDLIQKWRVKAGNKITCQCMKRMEEKI